MFDSSAQFALGMVETQGLIAGIEAADAMMKAANVKLLPYEKTVPALITIQVIGEVSAVQASVDAGVRAAAAIGQVVASHVIARPAEDLRRLILGHLDEGQAESNTSVSNDWPADLSACTVTDLRNIARNIQGLSLQGRDVSKANKTALIVALTEWKNNH